MHSADGTMCKTHALRFTLPIPRQVYISLSGDKGVTEEVLVSADPEVFARGTSHVFHFSGMEVGDNRSLTVRLVRHRQYTAKPVAYCLAGACTAPNQCCAIHYQYYAVAGYRTTHSRAGGSSNRVMPLIPPCSLPRRPSPLLAAPCTLAGTWPPWRC